MKKISALIIILTSIMIFFLTSVLFFVDYTTIYKKLLNNFNIEASADNLKQVQIAKFPFPHLYADLIKEEGKIHIQKLKIKFSLSSLLSFNPKIDAVDAAIVKINTNMSEEEYGLVNHSKLISGLINSNNANKINIGHLILFDNKGRNLFSFKDISLVGTERLSGKYDNAYFIADLINQDTGDILNLKVKHNAYELELKEHFENSELINGHSKIIIKDLQYFTAGLLTGTTNFFTNINISEDINISFDINYLDKILNLKNIIISSNAQSIQGEGDVKLTDSKSGLNEVNFKFSKINFINDNTRSLLKSPIGYQDINLFNKLGQINIQAEQCKFDQEQINNLNLTAILNQNIIEVKNLTGNFVNGGGFNIIGNISHNNYRNIFEGNVGVVHNDFNSLLNMLGANIRKDSETRSFSFNSHFKFTSIDLYLQNVSFKADNTQISGNIITKFIGGMPRIDAFLDFSLLNLTDSQYPLISPALDFIQDLTYNMKDANYLNKFIPIRKISYLGNFDLTFHNLKLLDNNFDKINLYINVAPSQINVNNLHINKDNDYIIAQLKLEASGLKPILDIMVNDGSLKIDFLKPSTLIGFKDQLQGNYSLDKIFVRVNGKLAKIYQNEIALNNVEFSLENAETLIKINSLNADLLSGKLTMLGSILQSPYTYNIVYALNLIDIGLLSKFIPPSLLEENQGRISCNGMLTTQGNSLDALFYNFYTKSTVSATSFIIRNFSIDELVQSINAPTYSAANLNNDIKRSMLTGETAFESLEGDVEINKGILMFKNMNFKTKTTTGAFNGQLDIYKFQIGLNSIFNFYDTPLPPGILYAPPPTELPVIVEGSYFQPSKTADSTKLEETLTKRAANPVVQY